MAATPLLAPQVASPLATMPLATTPLAPIPLATPLLLDAGVVFAVLAVGGALAARVRLSVIPAYIVVGVLLGTHSPVAPYAPPALDALFIEEQQFVELLAELGIVLLLFFIGLEFNLERLVAARDRITRAGSIDVALNGSVGAVMGFAFGFSALESLFLAGIVTISSSAVITKTLIDLGWIADPESEAVLGVLVFEDVVVAVYLAVLGAVALGSAGAGGGAGGGGGGSAGGAAGIPGALGLTGTAAIAGSLAIALGFIAALVALAAWGTPLLERLLDTDSDELFLLRVLGAAVLVGGVALAAGVSEAVAAFFLGAAFGGTAHASRIERVITSERDVYAAVFFLSIGLATDVALVAAVAAPLAALVVVTTASKLVSGFYGGRAYGLNDRRSVRVAVALVARGEFSLVIAALAIAAGLDPAISALAVGYVLVMSVLGTVLMRESHRVEGLLARAQGAAAGG